MSDSKVAQQLRAGAQPAGAPVAQPRCDRWSYILCLGLSLGLFPEMLGAMGCSSQAVSRPPADSGTVLPSCSVPLVCGDDGAVHSCDGQVVGGIVDDCGSRGQACSLGRCTSSPCYMAESRPRSLTGCLFYTVQPDNVAADEAAMTTYVVNNAGSDPANVQLERATPGTSETTTWVRVPAVQVPGNSAGVTAVQVPANSSARLQAGGLQVINAGTSTLSALRISSDRPITVAEIESDDQTQPATSTSGTIVLPLQSLGGSYRAVTYPQQASADVKQWVGSRGGAARVIIVGTQPGTKIEFQPASAVSGDIGQLVPPLAAGQSYPLTLNDGDVFQIYTNAPDEDLTGSLITVISGAPVAVFSGNISTSYGSNQTGINSADMAHEQMLPLSSWSNTYVAAPVDPQSSVGCTSFFGDSEGVGAGSIWRVLASQKGTEVEFGPPTPEHVWLDAGQSVTRISSAPFTVHASAPILLTQGMDCEPSLSLGISVGPRSLLNDYAFAAVPSFDQVIVVVRPSGAEVLLDGAPIPDSMFHTVDPDWDVAELPLPTCNAASGACLHRLTATPPDGFGVTLRGMDVSASYVLTAPGLLRCDSNSELCLN